MTEVFVEQPLLITSQLLPLCDLLADTITMNTQLLDSQTEIFIIIEQWRLRCMWGCVDEGKGEEGEGYGSVVV